MKKTGALIFLLFISFYSFSQSDFDLKLKEISNDIAVKLNEKNKKKIVVLYITDIDNNKTSAGKYIADVISYNIINSPENFNVFDREHLPEIIEAKKLMDEGYIDAIKAREIGNILSVEAIVIGNYTVLSSTLKLSLQALDVNSGFVFAASLGDLPLNADAGALLGINIPDSNSQQSKGFNTPIKSGENYNNPGTVNEDCETNNTGDYCFTNHTQKRLKVLLYIESGGGYGGGQRIKNVAHGYKAVSWFGGEITIEPGQTECFYNLRAINMVCDIREIVTKRGGVIPGWDAGYRKGNIFVERCKSKTFDIK